jgi:hypothetical protein
VGLPLPERQAKLIPGRKFAFDFAWAEQRLAVEVQGGIFLPKGAHTSGPGVTRDCEKGALAMLAGYRPLSVTGEHVRSGRALAWIEALLLASGGNCGPKT